MRLWVRTFGVNMRVLSCGWRDGRGFVYVGGARV